MIWKVGDIVVCKIETISDGKQKVLLFSPGKGNKISEMSFPIISRDEIMQTWKLLLPDNFVGWKINKFHIKYQGVDQIFSGKKFIDVPESLFLRKEKS